MVSKAAAKIAKLRMQKPAYWRNLGQKNICRAKIKKKMLILVKDYYRGVQPFGYGVPD